MCSSAKYVLSFTWVMITLRSSAPRPTITCLSRSCDPARGELPEPAAWLPPSCSSGAHIPGGEILPLTGGEGVDRHAHRLQLETRDLLVEVSRDAMNVLRQLLRV